MVSETSSASCSAMEMARSRPLQARQSPWGTDPLRRFWATSTATASLIFVNLNDNTVTILFGNGDGTFSTATSPVIVNQPGVIVTADFNGDGRLDFAIVDGFDNKEYVVLHQ